MDLVGEWELVPWESRASDGRVRWPGEERPIGDLIYTASGRMAVQVADSVREPLGTADPRDTDPAAQAGAFAADVAYCGTYQLDGDQVVHHVELSVHPDWVGTQQRRLAAIDGTGDLVLLMLPMAFGGETVVNQLHWRRRS